MNEEVKNQTETAVKKGRGRPKGSKNKPKIDQVATTPAPATETKSE